MSKKCVGIDISYEVIKEEGHKVKVDALKRQTREKIHFVLMLNLSERQKRREETRQDKEKRLLMGIAGGVAVLSVLAHRYSHYSFTPWL